MTLSYRDVAAERLGRPLVQGEIVHHVNGNHHDDRPTNLQVTTAALHRRIHQAMRVMRREWTHGTFALWLYPPPAPPDPMLRKAEVCERFRISTQTLTQWVRDGSLTAYKLGARTYRYSSAEIETFIAQAASSGQAS